MDKIIFLIFLYIENILCVELDDHVNTTSDVYVHHNTSAEHAAIHLASWNFEYVQVPLEISLFILATTMGKVAYHHADFLSSYIPESCILILVGTAMGAVFHHVGLARLNVFTPRLFFLILLPPIVLESAYSLHDRTFADNLGAVLMYAVLGTLLNWLLIGPVLYGLSQTMLVASSVGFISCMTFSALIVAVDPVAVLAIFEEVGVNNVLYFLVFGESLLNDAVTVVLYNMMKTFAQMDHISVGHTFLAIGSFFTVSLGGLLVGTVVGLISAFLSKFTNHVRVVEPLWIFLTAYCSYLCGELFHFSGIISMIGCGVIQAQYAFHNISDKSRTTVTYFSKMLSGLSEAVIFLFLGQALVTEEHHWDTGFVLSTLILCLIARFLVVFGLTFLLNKVKRGVRTIGIPDQFIMAYGGLRGAVGFSLSVMLNADYIPEKRLFMTATVSILLFTVFFQGITIKPLVKLLHIALRKDKNMTMIDEMNDHVLDHTMAGIEEVVGFTGKYFWREKMNLLDEKYLKPVLQREPLTEAEAIMLIYHQINMENHILALPGSQMSCDNGAKMISTPRDVTTHHVVSGTLPKHQVAKKLSLASVAHDVITQSRKDKQRLRDTDGARFHAVPSKTDSELETQRKLAVRCIRKWKPNTVLHRRYDRNLTCEDSQDLGHQLQVKRYVTRRMAHHISQSRSASRDVSTTRDNCLLHPVEEVEETV